MNAEFLILANVVLLTRLVCLLKDDAPTGAAWLGKAAVELLVLAALYRFSAAWGAAAGTIASMNLTGWWWEGRARRKNAGRLAIGLVGLALLSLFAAPGYGLAFRPALRALGGALGAWTALAPWADPLGDARVQLVIFGLLFAANEANLVMRVVFDWLDLKPLVPRDPERAASVLAVDVGEFNRGRVIGLLERALLYLFVLQGQYGAIGFVLAAKAFARFKALDDRPFAEYVLIGTLLSACLALAAGTAVQWLLRH